MIDRQFQLSEDLRVRRSFLGWWRDAFRNAWQDLRAVRWKRAGVWFMAVCWITALLVALILLSVLQVGGMDQFSACQGDDYFRLFPEKYSYWSSSGFFQITLGGGNLSFAEAKVIDVVWDVVFGRGGQALLALITWKVFAHYTTTSMQVRPVTFDTFRNTFVQQQPSISALLRTIRDFSVRHGLHSKVVMAFVVVEMIFILAFPTLGSAMSGYKGNVQSFVLDRTNNYIRFNLLSQVLYVIHDGERVNQTVDYPVVQEPYANTDPVFNSAFDKCAYYRQNPPTTSPDCYMQNNVSDYVKQHGFSGLLNTTSVFMNQTLPPPILNISAYYIDDETLYGFDLVDQTTKQRRYGDPSKATWVYENDTYDMDYVSHKGSCQTVEDYQWGFSFIQLYIVILMLLFWTIGIFSMWVNAHILMERRGFKDVAGEYKAVLELATSMHGQMSADIKDISTLTENQIRQRVKELRGGSIAYQTPMIAESFETPKGFHTKARIWLKKEKWWFSAFTLCFLGSTSLWILSLITIFFLPSLTFGFLIAICVGKTTGSRVVLLSCFFLLTGIIPLAFCMYLFTA